MTRKTNAKKTYALFGSYDRRINLFVNSDSWGKEEKPDFVEGYPGAYHRKWCSPARVIRFSSLKKAWKAVERWDLCGVVPINEGHFFYREFGYAGEVRFGNPLCPCCNQPKSDRDFEKYCKRLYSKKIDISGKVDPIILRILKQANYPINDIPLEDPKTISLVLSDKTYEEQLLPSFDKMGPPLPYISVDLENSRVNIYRKVYETSNGRLMGDGKLLKKSQSLSEGNSLVQIIENEIGRA